jgi:hypothetical protein
LVALADAVGPSASTGQIRSPWLVEDVPPDQQTSSLKPLLERDARLHELEACERFPAGLIRQLRANLFVECAPSIANLGSEESANLPKRAQATLHALSFAARLQRFASHANEPLVKLVTRKVADEYVKRHLEPWLNEHVQWLRLQEAVPAQFAEGSYARALRRAQHRRQA